jgi:DNA replication protein DnaC
VVSGAVAASLPEMLGRLKLTAMRDRLDALLDEAARRDLNLAEALALLCGAEVAHREERRIQMGLSIAKFPYVRTLEGFDFAAQPSLDPKQIRELAACRWVANGDTLLIQGPPGGWAKATSPSPSGARRCGRATPCCSPRRWR